MRGEQADRRMMVLVLASLTLSAISLFVAISGAANAGDRATKLPPNSVGTEQLKPGAVQATDVSAAAITSQALSPRAVTASALSPGAVTSTAMAPNAVTPPAIAPGAVTNQKLGDKAVSGSKLAPSSVNSSNLADNAVTGTKLSPLAVGPRALAIPELSVHAENLSSSLDLSDCQGFGNPFVGFSQVRSNTPSMFDSAHPTDLVAPSDGVYQLTFSWSWSSGDGYVRGAYVSRARGDALDVVGLPSASPGPTGYNQTVDAGAYPLQKGDSLRVAPLACGAGFTPATAPTLDSFDVTMKWVAPTS